MCIIEDKDIGFNLIYFGDKKNISATDSFINEKMGEKVIMPASDEKDKDMGRGQGLKIISILTLFFLIIPFTLVAITNMGTRLNPFDYLRQELLTGAGNSSINLAGLIPAISLAVLPLIIIMAYFAKKKKENG